MRGHITGKTREQRKYEAGRSTAHVDAKRGMSPEAQRRVVVASMNAGDDMDWIEGYVYGLRQLGRSEA
jgi:hypothetical protein